MYKKISIYQVEKGKKWKLVYWKCMEDFIEWMYTMVQAIQDNDTSLDYSLKNKSTWTIETWNLERKKQFQRCIYLPDSDFTYLK